MNTSEKLFWIRKISAFSESFARNLITRFKGRNFMVPPPEFTAFPLCAGVGVLINTVVLLFHLPPIALRGLRQEPQPAFRLDEPQTCFEGKLRGEYRLLRVVPVSSECLRHSGCDIHLVRGRLNCPLYCSVPCIVSGFPSY